MCHDYLKPPVWSKYGPTEIYITGSHICCVKIAILTIRHRINRDGTGANSYIGFKAVYQNRIPVMKSVMPDR